MLNKSLGEGSSTEKSQKEALEIATEVEERFRDLLKAFSRGDRYEINNSVEKFCLFSMDFPTPAGPYSSATQLLEGEDVVLKDTRDRINQFLEDIHRWMNGLQIPVVGWDKEEARTLDFNEVKSDVENTLALEVHRVLQEMSNPNRCLQVKNPDGKITCPHCDKRIQSQSKSV